MKGIYLDNNATTRVDPRVWTKIIPYLDELFYNPSAQYTPSHQVKEAVEEARKEVAQLIGAKPSEIVFTSGGSESNNTAIKGVALALKEKGNHIITSAIEHHAVLEPCHFLQKHLGFDVTYLPVDRYGLVDPEEVKKAIRKETILITVMHANNEIGTIEPIEEIGKIGKEAGVYFHTDAVQSVGKLEVDVNKLGVDLLSLSGHKFHGPKGTGALYIRKGTKLHPLIHGGGQEGRRRAGTENVPGIMALGEAARLARLEREERYLYTKKLRDTLEKGILENIPHVLVNGHPQLRLPNTLSVCFLGIEGESILMDLNFQGVWASSGSACSSGSLEPSHVLLAIGLSHEQAHGSVRFSVGKFNTQGEIEKVLEVLPSTIERLREMSPMWQEGEVQLT